MDSLTHCGTVEITTERLYLKKIEKCDALQMFTNFAVSGFVFAYDNIFPSVEIVTTCHGINLPLF